MLGTALAAVIMRQTRSSMIETLSTDYVRTARAKGLRERRVLTRFALRNSLIVVVTIIGLQLGGLISGAVVTERIFGLPGFGKLTLDSVFTRDYPVIQAVVLVITTGLHHHQPGDRRPLLRHQPADPRGREGLMSDNPRSPTTRADGRPRPRGARQVLRQLLRNPLGVAGGVPAAARRAHRGVRTAARAVLADARCTSTRPSSARSPIGFPLGTDDLGRDVLSRIVYGTRVSLRGRRCCPCCSPSSSARRWASLAGYWGWLDAVVSRLTDLTLAFPFLIIAVGLAAINGASLTNAADRARHRPGADDGAGGPGRDAAASRSWSSCSRRAAWTPRAGGSCSPTSCRTPLSAVIVQATVIMPVAVIGEALLSFLGLGIQPPTPSLGIMLSDAQQYIFRAPTAAVFPGLAIAVICLAFNLFGDALRDALDPTTRTR